ncbi:MAG: HNH endonuclease [Rickettsiales bacterium]|jgi:5-methylcytosine-specific restriction protein A|nr:HNH endonuclease [Rickettsiales bacterium]
MKRKICNYPGCNILINQNERYCTKHKREPEKPFSSAIRFNEALYKTTRWKQLRKKILSEQLNCFKCGISGKEAKLEVHHIIPPRGNENLFFDENNLIAVCSTCHKIITNIEIRERKYENKK